MKIRKPIDAATRPGTSTGISEAPNPPASSSRIPATSGPPKSAEIAENEPGGREHVFLRPVGAREARGGEADDGAEGNQRCLGTENRTERQRADRREGDAGRVGDRRRRNADSPEWRVPAVARQQAARREDDAGSGEREADHEVPGRRGGVEPVGEVVPQPVLELVDDGDEHGGDERGRDPDESAEEDEAERSAAGACRRRLQGAHTRPSAAQARTVSPNGSSEESAARANVTGTPYAGSVSRVSELESELDALAAETAFSGAVRVDRSGEVELAKAYGLAHRGYEIPNEVDTRFATASATKGLTALTVVSLIEEGRLESATTARSSSAATCR